MFILFALVLLGGLSAFAILPVSLVNTAYLPRLKNRLGRCHELGCWEPGNSCYLPDNYDWESPDELLCWDHQKHLYCHGCGQFWGGIESFDFVHPGWCDNCWDEIKANDCDNYQDHDDCYYGENDPYDMY